MSSNETEPTGTPARTESAPRGRRPPPGRKWRKGESGNPSGSSRLEVEVRKLARSYGAEAIERLVVLMRQKGNKKIAMQAALALLDRGYGKPPVEISGPNGSPIPLGFVTGAPITNALEAGEAYRALLGGQIDPASLVFDVPQAVAQRPVAIEAPVARDAELIVAPAQPGAVPLALGEDPTLPQLKPDDTVGAWQRLAK